MRNAYVALDILAHFDAFPIRLGEPGRAGAVVNRNRQRNIYSVHSIRPNCVRLFVTFNELDGRN